MFQNIKFGILQSDCPQPQDVENGGLDIDDSPLEGLGYQNGTTALYTCAQDHHLDPRGSTGRRVCINGAWTGIQVGCGKQRIYEQYSTFA